MARIISVKHIKEFMIKHSQYAESLKAWISIVEDKNTIWLKPQDILDTFGAKAVDIIKNNRVVIDVKGNKIRIIAKYQFPGARLYIKWIGTHAEYDKLCEKNQQYTIDLFK
ncbi:MAG: type II toxin-antitoxin system HigB family toxin [Bacteroidia bacterium]|nr:type II toxin-antitoxin system HigB family toxin [Bacteroidia bacterium]